MLAAGDDAGMTLLEALVVMGLMALIATIVFPNIERALGLLQLRETAGALTANLQLAHSDAIRSEQNILFSLSSDGRSYSWSEGEVRQVPGHIGLRMSKGQSIEFFGDGTTSGGEITAFADGREISIFVDDSTGAVTTVR